VSTSSGPTDPTALDATAENPPDAKLRCLPYCFVADTDSIPFVLDTGANRMIINNVKLFKHFKSRKGNVKGIGGAPVKLFGGGTVRISLKADDGTVLTDVDIDDAVYVPTSPFNLIPPQILISKMRHDGHYDNYAKHDDREYVFSYGATVQSKLKTLTVHIGVNKLFTMRTNEGYNSFFLQSQEFDPEWSEFAGVSHVIPDDDASESPNTSESIDQQREHSSSQLSDKTRELYSAPTTQGCSPSNETLREPSTSLPNIIPFDESNFDPLKAKPIPTEFTLDGKEERRDAPSTAAYKQRQEQLMMIHERLSHMSFARLKMLAHAGHIPRELSTVKNPACPGCAYGKAHRLRWRTSGIRNCKKLRVAKAPGDVVSME
jgi:hypothetical protein